MCMNSIGGGLTISALDPILFPAKRPRPTITVRRTVRHKNHRRSNYRSYRYNQSHVCQKVRIKIKTAEGYWTSNYEEVPSSVRINGKQTFEIKLVRRYVRPIYKWVLISDPNCICKKGVQNHGYTFQFRSTSRAW
jgi:hypothetical protein